MTRPITTTWTNPKWLARRPFYGLPHIEDIEEAIEEVLTTLENLPCVTECSETVAMDVQELQRLVLQMEGEAKAALRNGDKKPEWACEKLQQTTRDLLSFLDQLRDCSRSLRTKGIGGIIVNALMTISRRATDNEVILLEMKDCLDESWPSIERDLTSVLEIIREINDLQQREDEWKIAEESAQFIEQVVEASRGYRSVDEHKRRPASCTPGFLAAKNPIWPPEDKPVFVLTGDMGVGKSPVAHQFCVHLETTASPSLFLGASFFFSRGREHLESARYLLPALAYQLQSTLRSGTDILGTMRECLHHGDQEGMQQRLLRKVLVDGPPAPAAVVLAIDGIDECKDRDEVPVLLRFLLEVVRELPWIRLLIASRPHANVMSVLAHPDVADIVHHQSLHSGVGNAREYLEARVLQIPSYSQLLREHPNMLRRLLRRTKGDSVFARVAANFLDLVHDNPKAQMQLLLSGTSKASSPLTALYTLILRTASHPSHDQLISLPTLLSLIAAGQKGIIHSHSPPDHAFISAHYAVRVVDGLRCVLTVDANAEIIPIDTSFRQFLLDTRHCPKQYRMPPAFISLAVMANANPLSAMLASFPPVGPLPTGRREVKHPLLTLWPKYLDTEPWGTEPRHLAAFFVPSPQLAMYAWVTKPAQAMRAGQALLNYFRKRHRENMKPICIEYFKFVSYVHLIREQHTPFGQSYPPLSTADVTEAIVRKAHGNDKYSHFAITLEQGHLIYAATDHNDRNNRLDLTIKEEDLTRYQAIIEDFMQQMRQDAALAGPSFRGLLEGTYRIDDWV